MAGIISTPDIDSAVARIAASINEQLPSALFELLRSGANLGAGPLRLECSLSAGEGLENNDLRRTKLASVDIRQPVVTSPDYGNSETLDSHVAGPMDEPDLAHRQYTVSPVRTFRPRIAPTSPVYEPDPSGRPAKRRKATGGLRIGGAGSPDLATLPSGVTRQLESDTRVFPQRKKRSTDNPALQPSTLEKFFNGVWHNLCSGEKMDPAEVIEQWQAIQGTGQPKLLADTVANNEVVTRDRTVVSGLYSRINILTRRISQTSKTCRSLEVIVQAYWVQCFEDRVAELSGSLTKEKAKKSAIAEACVDFGWSEKELRNKMGIWRGYHDICKNGGWAALVFAGHGLYRFCKYRAVAFTEDTFTTLKALKPRFEVAADTLHPNWRHLTSIVGAPTERRYTGHPHEWVVGGPSNEPVPLSTTYGQWDPDFSYTHLDSSIVDEETWGLFDPRVIHPADDPKAHTCPECHEKQSDDVTANACNCFPNLYGANRHSAIPVQVFRTPKGCNNGLVACCAFERGTAVGEFIGQVTSGLANMDVMVGQTEKASYQIWQGKQGNHTRFVNHSCQPNSQFERFVWLGTQRIVLVSKGIEAGEEVTVDYSDTYWKNLDKECLCGQRNCRYRGRARMLTPPQSR